MLTHKQQKEAQDLPATFAALSSAHEDRDEGEKNGAFKDHRERHQEADGSPNRAEVAVGAVAVFIGRETRALSRCGRAPPVESVGICDGASVGLKIQMNKYWTRT
jgi:hypothetical protein